MIPADESDKCRPPDHAGDGTAGRLGHEATPFGGDSVTAGGVGVAESNVCSYSGPVELDAPSGDRTWADVGRTLALNPSARLSPAACRVLVRAHVELRAALERIAEDPTSTRAQLRALVPNERQAQTRARAAEVRRRRAEHDAWSERVRANAGARHPSRGRALSDQEILAIPRMMALVKAVADGRVVAEADARWLSDLALIDRAGPSPAVTERGRRLLWLWRR